MRRGDERVGVLFLASVGKWYFFYHYTKPSLEGDKTVGTNKLLPCTHLLTLLWWVSVGDEAHRRSVAFQLLEVLCAPCTAK